MVIVTIAIGIGINIGIFSLTKAIFLNSLGVPGADRLVYYTLGNGADIRVRFSDDQYEALRATAAMDDLLAWQPTTLTQRTLSGTSPLKVALVSGNAFSVLGLKPFAGRFFSDADDVPEGGKNGWTAVLSYSYWKEHWASDPSVLGQMIKVDEAQVQIVGVLPPEFSGVEPLNGVDVLLPRHFGALVNTQPLLLGGAHMAHFVHPILFVLGKLPAGTSIQQVQTNLKAIEPSFMQAADLAANLNFLSIMFPNTAPGTLLGVHDGQMGVTLEFQSLRDPLLALEGLAGAVLLFCGSNLVLLFINRARREAHATAVRQVLGARLGDLLRPALMEAATLAASGCLLAAPVAWSAARFLSIAIRSSPGFTTFAKVSPSYSLLLTTALVALAVGCLAAVTASLWLSKRGVSIRLSETGHFATLRSKSWIIGFEVSAAIVLLTGSIASVVGFQTLSRHSGFGDGSAVITKPNLRGATSSDLDRIVTRIKSYPEVRAVATAYPLPFAGKASSFFAEPLGSADGARRFYVSSVVVSLDYFSAIGTRIVMGRSFRRNDLADSVCIISNNVARGLFPGENPVGEHLRTPKCRIVGVAEDAHFSSMSESPDAIVYELTPRMPAPPASIIANASTSQLGIQAVRDAVQSSVPGGLSTIEPIQTRVDESLRLWKLMTFSGTICASLAGVILLIGFFGILSLQVSERKREIGIRIALGAELAGVSAALVKTVVAALLFGLATGSAGALITATKLAEIYGLSVTSVVAAYIGGLFLLGVLMIAAAVVPLSRALAISPVDCLRSE